MLRLPKQYFPALPLMVRCIAACWLITKLLCHKLWLADRLFPLVPVHDILYEVPNNIHLFLFAVMLLSLAALMIFPQKKWICTVMIIAEIVSCMLDQNRWQPWEYQFTFMLVVYVALTDQARIILCWQIIFIGIYFFSGINKLNHGFILQVWHTRILKQMFGIGLQNVWLFRLGWLLPLFEISGAVALIFYRTRKIGVIMLCAMHIFIFFMIEPVRLHFKGVIGPWNIVMPILLIGLFLKHSFNISGIKKGHYMSGCIILFWWVLPWLHFIGRWDSYLSSSLYSGKVQYLYVCTSNQNTRKLFSDELVRTSNAAPCDTMLSIFNWSMRELNTSPNGETRVFKKIITQWQSKFDSTRSDQFFIHFPKFTKQKWIKIDSPMPVIK